MASSPNVKTFTDANFDQEVLKSQVPVLVDVSATWCMPCQFLAKTIDAVADEIGPKAKVGVIDADENRATMMNLGVMSLPTVFVFKAGKVVKTFMGGSTKKDELLAALADAAR
ncbi:MAG TPA: thioredoxin domain-containing protein [Phycisphaerales bacterium]|nr:thioredoxin domain-containing protein [Phycisphaerales bacterium]